MDELETWKETILIPTLASYAPQDIYNGDETALFYKSLPHRTYCYDGDKPAGSTKRKDRITLLMITNMDGSDHRKLAVIGKAKTPRCLMQKYKMGVKDMAVDWYASKNAWMTGEIHHQIMTKLNNQMKLANRHILYVCDNASSHQVRDYSNIKFLLLPPNATSIVQPLDQGIILSAKRRYKKKLAERYLVCFENDKDANALLKSLDIVQATNMIAAAWRDTSSTIIQNCFRKAGFKHHAVDPETQDEGPAPTPTPDIWNKVQRIVGDIEFDEFVASEPVAETAPPMTDDDIVNLVRTENDTKDESDDDEEEATPLVTAIKTSSEFLAMLDQQRAFLKRHNMETNSVDELEAQVISMQVKLCSKQKQVIDYFKTVDDIRRSKEISMVDSLVIDDEDLESIDTTVASVAASALMRNQLTPGCASTPKRKVLSMTPSELNTRTPKKPRISMTPVTEDESLSSPRPSTSTPSRPDIIRRRPMANTQQQKPVQKKLNLQQACDKIMNSDTRELISFDDSDSMFSQSQ